ncbi:MAG: putative signal transduction histidine kinase [Solirubrobacterales bacterium]|nr:putative signal transduction histidine kinase [Solirubrobacterales bacterium]
MSGDDGFRHEALFYADGDQGFLDATLTLVERALASDAAVLVAVGPARTSALRQALGERGEDVRFAEMQRIGGNPAQIIPVWHEFLREHAGASMLGIGEPVWPGRSAPELDECGRHESLLNAAFDDGPGWHLLCPYDLDGLDDHVIEAARRTHPLLACDGISRASEQYMGAEESRRPFAGELGPRPRQATKLAFSTDDLGRLRHLVASWAQEHSLALEGREDLVLAVNELATNSIRYGGGGGTLRVWREGESLLCEVQDGGRMEPPLVGRIRPKPDANGGRGVWIANQLCDLVQIRSSPAGTVVRVHKALGG